MAALLSPLAAVYGSIAARRLEQPGAGVGIPVICVGNPTVGGAGKTPAAIAIARMLIAAGEKPYFLTRGYGGRLAGPALVEDGHTAVQVGDEPLLLARVAPVVVAANRVAGAQLAKNSGAGVIVMDDGFQNPSLAKDLAILVVDARGAGNGRVLPAGPLRAPLEPQMARAAALLVVGSNGSPIEAATHLPVFHAVLEPEPHAIAELKQKKFLAFAGIGDPEKFFATLSAVGIDAPVRRSFGDHHRYTVREARALLREAAQNKLDLLTTEKDLARLKGDVAAAELAVRTRALPVALKVKEAEDFARLLRGALP